MRTILSALWRYENNGVLRVKRAVEKTLLESKRGIWKSRAVNESWRRLKLSENQILLFTAYATTCGETLPISMNLITERRYFDDWQEWAEIGERYYDYYEHHVNFTITHAALSLGNLYPVSAFENVHKHVCVCSFDDEIPPIIKRLPVEHLGRERNSILLSNVPCCD